MGRRQVQREFSLRMEWGLPGAEEITRDADYAVIVDVLSFTTTVSVALDQGVEVFPYPWHDESAQAFARRNGAILAVGRSVAARAAAAGDRAGDTRAGDTRAGNTRAGNTRDTRAGDTRTDDGPPLVSLSPASIRAATGLDRIVLPSPNGSALSRALARSGHPILAACLRNRTAVAAWLAKQAPSLRRPPVIAVVAAGERWPDGTLRPALEDFWGAGAVIGALENLGFSGLSPEARAAAAAWQQIEANAGAALSSCVSGTELVDAGFGADVTIASELDASTCVPLLSDGRFADASLPTLHPRVLPGAMAARWSVKHLAKPLIIFLA